ncbi:thermonuclease family protein [Cucumibacter marinus]|uniref:thermonuclease family protein n=1 Tax=Cucumibacter marinus TaxID=1121252 RepID=UPI001FE186B5|nr:thermonuclease family protein [Cucumibacter marinus]
MATRYGSQRRGIRRSSRLLATVLPSLIAFAVSAGVGTLLLRGDLKPVADFLLDRKVMQTIASPKFASCPSSNRINCFVDGDTLWIDGEKIRLTDINTPEISTPECASERRLGHEAKRRLIALVNEGPFDVVRDGARDADRYGRKLRVLERDGVSLGQILVTEGLARTWSGRRGSWC